jgi:hypothetical protein
MIDTMTKNLLNFFELLPTFSKSHHLSVRYQLDVNALTLVERTRTVFLKLNRQFCSYLIPRFVSFRNTRELFKEIKNQQGKNSSSIFLQPYTIFSSLNFHA